MKKQLIISTVLLTAMATTITSISNVETQSNENQTEFDIQFKDVTNNVRNGIDYMIKFMEEIGGDSAEADAFEKYSYNDMKVMIPTIGTLDLRDSSIQSPTSDQDDSFEVGLKIDIDLMGYFEVEDSDMEELETIAYMPDEIFLNYSEEKGFYGEGSEQVISKESGQIEGQEGIYNFQSISDFWMEDYSFSSDNFEESIDEGSKGESAFFYMVNGNGYGSLMGGKSDQNEPFWQPSEPLGGKGRYEILESSKNEVSLYARRFKDDGTSNRTSVIDEQYLIETETFTQKDINPGLSGGAIAGIVIGSMAGVVLLGAGGYLIYVKKFA